MIERHFIPLAFQAASKFFNTVYDTAIFIPYDFLSNWLYAIIKKLHVKTFFMTHLLIALEVLTKK